MKSKLINDLLRWVIVPLLLGSVLAWGATQTYSGTAAPESKSAQKKNKTDAVNADPWRINDRIKELEDRERLNYAMELEGQRKKTDWLLGFLGVLAAIMAIGGALIPFLMARKDKEIIEQDKAQIRKLLDEVMSMKDDAESSVEKIHQHEAEASDAKKTVLAYTSGTSSAEESEKIREAVATVEQDEGADYLLRLRAEAIAASQAGDAEKAYSLWCALIALSADDAGVHFNAGFWAGQVSEKQVGVEKLHWLKLVQRHSEQALKLEPKMYDAAYNWGRALIVEASILASTEPQAASALWRQAGEKCQLALQIKPDLHQAAHNWGLALASEARVLASANPDAARMLWKQAGEKYQLSISIQPDKPGTALMWGNSLAEEAQVLASTDLQIARVLWKQAGEKYQMELGVKPDMHESANNWGLVLLTEASAIAATESEESIRLLAKAEQLLLSHADAAPGAVAYNLACLYGLRADVQSCLKWLKIGQEHKTLPNCAHLMADKDLDAVRNDNVFVEWFKQVCP